MPRKKVKWFVYLLLCRDGSLYAGATNDLVRRFAAHRAGVGSKYVRSRQAKKIVYAETLSGKSAALKREREIKGYSRQKKLQLLK